MGLAHWTEETRLATFDVVVSRSVEITSIYVSASAELPTAHSTCVHVIRSDSTAALFRDYTSFKAYTFSDDGDSSTRRQNRLVFMLSTRHLGSRELLKKKRNADADASNADNNFVVRPSLVDGEHCRRET